MTAPLVPKFPPPRPKPKPVALPPLAAGPRRPVRNRRGQPGRCSSGKVRYRDHEEAVAALAASRAARSFGDGRRLEDRAYECPDCLGFHLTKRYPRQGEPL